MISSRKRKAIVAYLTRKIIDMGDGSYLIQGRKLRKGGRAPSFIIQPNHDTGELECQCEGFAELFECKHMGALKKFLIEGEPKVGYDNLDDTKRATYPQDGPRYRMARRVLLRALPLAVRALANSVFPINRLGSGKTGRPRIPMRDLVVCIAIRTIHHRGGDLAQAFVDDLYEKRLLYRRPTLTAAPPATPTITANMRRNPEVAAAIQQLIAATNAPFRGHPTRVGIDGSEFNCPTQTEGKGGKRRLVNISTVKLHAAVDIDSGLIVAVTVTPGKDGEAEQAVKLLDEVRTMRFVTNFVADRGYVAEFLFNYLDESKIDFAIPTKANISTKGDGVMAQHARAWRDRTDEEKNLYAMRGICESAFSRLKALTEEDLRGMTFGAQATELLSHVLVANVAWLVSRYVYGEIDLAWLDDRCKRILEPARNIVKDLPHADRTPKYRDGYEGPEAA